MAALAALFQPVAPAKMAVLAMSLGLAGTPTLEEARREPLSGRRVTKVPPLFPKVDQGVFEGI
jgi:hypothetical protein